jgi:hypothetical protein
MPYVGKKPADIIATAVDTTTGKFSGVVDADAGITVDNITIDGTEIDLSSGDLTIDVAGDIILDADGADVSFRDGGTGHLSISNSSNDAVITSLQNDKDMIFKGVDGGSVVTALTLDMSDAGTAVFNKNITVTDGSISSGVTHTFSLFGATGTGGSANYVTYSFVGDPNTGMFSGTADTLKFATGGSEQMRISAGGHVGIGVVPETSINTLRTLQIGNGGAIMSHDSSGSTNSLYASSNAYYSTGWKYINTGTATEYKGINGEHVWSNASSGSADGAITWSERMRIDANGHVTIPNQPAFLVSHSANQTNFSAGGSAHTVAFDTEIFDQGSNFASNTFTAPIAGRYQLQFSMNIRQVDTAATVYSFVLQTSNRQYELLFDPNFSEDGLMPICLSALADMDASDTAFVKFFQSGGAQQSDLNNAPELYFSGFLAC